MYECHTLTEKGDNVPEKVDIFPRRVRIPLTIVSQYSNWTFA